MNYEYQSSMAWALGQEGMYLLDARGTARGQIVYRAFGSDEPRPLGEFRIERPYLVYGRHPGGRLAVSPDEDELLYVEYSNDGSSIYVIDDFR